MLKKVFASSVILSLALPVAFAAENLTVDCDSDPVFSEYSCNQCFDGGVKGQGEYVGFLTDAWKNDTEFSKLMYKEIQKMPEIYSLDTTNVEWSEVPNSEDFWEYPADFENLYSEDHIGYVLAPGEETTWIQTKLDAAYNLVRNEAGAGENIGLLVYSINSGNILEGGEIGEFSEHNECVLYKSGDEVVKPVTPTTLPQTGPAEFFLLLILAMVLGFGIVKFRNNNA